MTDEAPEAEPWISPDVWWKALSAANPALGVTLRPEVVDEHANCRVDCLIYSCSAPEACCNVIPEKPQAPELIEQEAARLVRSGARQKDYGHPRGDFDMIASFWSPILKVSVTAEQVALCMIGLKMARLTSNPKHHDSLVDVIGYAICYDRLDEAA